MDILFKRYIWLIELLKRFGELTFNEISEKWEATYINDTGSKLTKRTFYNHCQAIFMNFGIDIVCRRGRGNNVYYIKNPDAIDSSSLIKWSIDSISVSELIYEISLGKVLKVISLLCASNFSSAGGMLLLKFLPERHTSLRLTG